MAQIIRADIDQQNIQKITIIVEPDDYKEQYKSELQKHQGQFQMKGFRKGKTPTSVVEKLYGRSILGDVVNEHLTTQLQKEINEIEYILEPIFSEDQAKIEFNHRDLNSSYTFNFEVALNPQFELKGITPDYVYPKYALLEDAEGGVDRLMFDIARVRLISEAVESEIAENDIIYLSIKELEAGIEKPNGVQSTFSTLYLKNVLFESFYEKLQGKKVNDTFQFNIYEVEKNTSEKEIYTYYLEDLDESVTFNAEFEATIDKVTRPAPHLLTADFWQQFFNKPEPITMEEVRANLKEMHVARFEDLCEEILDYDIRTKLMEVNDVPLPLPFIMRWWNQSNPNPTDGAIYFTPALLKFMEQLKWELIVNKILNVFKVDVTDRHIIEFCQDFYWDNIKIYEDIPIELWFREATKNKKFMSHVMSRVCDEQALTKVTALINTETFMLEEKALLEMYNDKIVPRHGKDEADFLLEEKEDEKTNDMTLAPAMEENMLDENE